MNEHIVSGPGLYMKERPDDRSGFAAGLHAERAEFRHMDVNGRPVDAANEGDTARSERIRALQDRRTAEGGREPPATDPRSVMTEWMAQSAANRMSGFAQNLAEHAVAGLPRVGTWVEYETGKPMVISDRDGLLEETETIRDARFRITRIPGTRGA